MDKTELCEKIKEIYPELGECGINLNVNFNEEKKAWIVELKKDKQALTTHLETDEANKCMEGKQCISLGLQIGMLAENIKKLQGIS